MSNNSISAGFPTPTLPPTVTYQAYISGLADPESFGRCSRAVSMQNYSSPLLNYHVHIVAGSSTACYMDRLVLLSQTFWPHPLPCYPTWAAHCQLSTG